MVDAACLQAIEIVQGSITSGEMTYGMVVTGDSEPFYGFIKGLFV